MIYFVMVKLCYYTVQCRINYQLIEWRPVVWLYHFVIVKFNSFCEDIALKKVGELLHVLLLVRLILSKSGRTKNGTKTGPKRDQKIL